MPDKPVITDRVAYWDHYAAGMRREMPQDALKDAFGWTQYPEHGPGGELLGDPASALEIGFGRGNAVAALAVKGVEATGVDMSPRQVVSAKERWGHLPGARFEEGDALAFLAATTRRWDAIYSIFGGLWFIEPAQWLPLVRLRLTPGGKVVFSHAPPVPGSYGLQGMYGAGFTGRRVWVYRWAYEPEVWARMLEDEGYEDVHARVEPAPDADHVGTLIVEGRSPGACAV
ncbi:SAM-dependent methyltransferase [Spongiactinospora rosea]|uniref:SAM-dependent methyltransferase n=1 Tax=Spongiactinospora rosea TaxID=2248750 RepID=A0A366LQ50_9ACTN|nr:class I SAM-dependent methyltransferase [Spongiactinospora rosea]RBQ15539.1 SAM-dependent methyltransferase [Spongiactinospora rosea]